jgi:hypothetical protein
MDRNSIKIRRLLKATVGGSNYNSWRNTTEYGYHSYDLGGIQIPGQRSIRDRVDVFRDWIDFNGLVAVDLGCNSGGILHHLPELKSGAGFDFDASCIKSAQGISNILGSDYTFTTHDFDKQGLPDIGKPDVIFMLSLCSWVKSWRDLVAMAISKNCPVVFETNNEKDAMVNLPFIDTLCESRVLILDNSNDDTTGNHGRKTYILNLHLHNHFPTDWIPVD